MTTTFIAHSNNMQDGPFAQSSVQGSDFNYELQQAFEAVETQIPVIQEDRRYWFVRTNSGEFFDDFLDSNSIGIGYNMLDLALLGRVSNGREGTLKGRLGDQASLFYPQTQAKKAAGLVLRFIYEMQPGDIVVMPSDKGRLLAFGEVDEGEVFELEGDRSWDDTEERNGNEPSIPYRKRRPVKWIKTIAKNSIENRLFKAFQTPQALSEIDSYADVIDRTLQPLYKKGEKYYFTIEVDAHTGLDGEAFIELGNDILTIQRLVSSELFVDRHELAFQLKADIQSPGRMQIIALRSGYLVVALLGVMGVIYVGGGANVDSKKIDTKGGIQTEGYLIQNSKAEAARLKAISQYKNDSLKREIIARATAHMDSIDGRILPQVLDALREPTDDGPAQAAERAN